MDSRDIDLLVIIDNWSKVLGHFVETHRVGDISVTKPIQSQQASDDANRFTRRGELPSHVKSHEVLPFEAAEIGIYRAE